jgi:hypothetical protein
MSTAVTDSFSLTTWFFIMWILPAELYKAISIFYFLSRFFPRRPVDYLMLKLFLSSEISGSKMLIPDVVSHSSHHLRKLKSSPKLLSPVSFHASYIQLTKSGKVVLDH